MKSFFWKAAGTLALAGMFLGTPAFAAGLPVAAFKPLKLPAFVTKAGAIGYTVPLSGAQVVGTVASVESETAIVTDGEDIDYTVDLEDAYFANVVGKKVKERDVAPGDRLVVDGYLAKNSTGMSARRVINLGPAKKTALE